MDLRRNKNQGINGDTKDSAGMCVLGQNNLTGHFCVWKLPSIGFQYGVS